MEYKTQNPYGEPITLNGSYEFNWLNTVGGTSFMILEVNSSITALDSDVAKKATSVS